ncbi:MAG TPA: RHS repeat-associated core domain-containing protein, partial [Polyangiaceae bacterium]|nr:RHS repeat-associated core domain-containing protein [Polyangiaceae bacterium]
EVSSPFRLLGQYADDETGLCYTRFRYFDAEAGRWCSPDPLGIVGGPNLLSFSGAPQRAIDPYGLCPKKVYRGMRETPEGPQTGPTARTLGARPDKDIPVDDGRVVPGTGGISVSPDDPRHLPPHRRPKEFGGTGKDPVWELDTNDLGPHLQYDEDKPGQHGTIQPAYPMSLEDFQTHLAETQGKWKKVDP